MELHGLTVILLICIINMTKAQSCDLTAASLCYASQTPVYNDPCGHLSDLLAYEKAVDACYTDNNCDVPGYVQHLSSTCSGSGSAGSEAQSCDLTAAILCYTSQNPVYNDPCGHLSDLLAYEKAVDACYTDNNCDVPGYVQHLSSTCSGSGSVGSEAQSCDLTAASLCYASQTPVYIDPCGHLSDLLAYEKAVDACYTDNNCDVPGNVLHVSSLCQISGLAGSDSGSNQPNGTPKGDGCKSLGYTCHLQLPTLPDYDYNDPCKFYIQTDAYVKGLEACYTKQNCKFDLSVPQVKYALVLQLCSPTNDGVCERSSASTCDHILTKPAQLVLSTLSTASLCQYLTETVVYLKETKNCFTSNQCSFDDTLISAYERSEKFICDLKGTDGGKSGQAGLLPERVLLITTLAAAAAVFVFMVVM